MAAECLRTSATLPGGQGDVTELVGEVSSQVIRCKPFWPALPAPQPLDKQRHRAMDPHPQFPEEAHVRDEHAVPRTHDAVTPTRTTSLRNCGSMPGGSKVFKIPDGMQQCMDMCSSERLVDQR